MDTEMLRYAQHLTARRTTGLCRVTACHAERSEASLAMGTEMLRYAQHDKNIADLGRYNSLSALPPIHAFAERTN